MVKSGLLDKKSDSNKSGMSDEFYALLYLRLYYKERGYDGKAKYYMKSVCNTEYTKRFGSYDYMVAVANIYYNIRGWVQVKPSENQTKNRNFRYLSYLFFHSCKNTCI